MNKSPEQLEAEADELLRQEGLLPPVETKPDSEEVTPPDDPVDDPDPEPETPAGDEATDTPAHEAGIDVPAADQPASPAAADTDDLNGLTLENAQERIKNAQARMHRATADTAEFRRQNAELTNRLQTLEAQVTTLQSELSKPKPPVTPDSAPARYESLEALRDDYPTLVGPLLDIAQNLGSQVNALKEQVTSLGGKVDSTSTVVTQNAEAEVKARRDAARKEHIDTILARHADAFEVNESDEFNGWLDRQPPMYRVAMQRGSATDIVDVLDKYKKAIGETRVVTARAVATPTTPKARTQPTKTKPTFTRAQISAMSPAQFAANEEAIDAAVAEGRVT